MVYRCHHLAAIKTYLKLGFLPQFPDETHRERWVVITRKLTPGSMPLG